MATGMESDVFTRKHYDHEGKAPMICRNCYQRVGSIEKKMKDLDVAKKKVTSNFILNHRFFSSSKRS